MSKILYPILILFVFCFNSCKDSETTANSTTDIEQDSSSIPEFEHRIFLSVNAQNLRIRRTPDLEGEVAVTLPLNSIVEYLHDSTKFTTPITYNGEKYNSHWYKIRTANKIQGWIYGGLAYFLTETENRRIITLEKSNDDIGSSKSTSKKTAPQQADQAILDKYKEQLNKLSSTNPQSISTATSLYSNTFSNANTLTRDLGFQSFQSFHSLVLKQLQQQQNFNKYNQFQKEIEVYGKAHMTLDELTIKLGENGFNFGFDKNASNVYLKKDLDFVARYFYKEVSGEMREYIDQEQLEDETPWLENNKLLISPQQLAKWVIFWDNFLIKYPNFVLKNKVFQSFNQKQDLLLEGCPKTPAFADNQLLHSNFKTAYIWILEEQGNSRFGVFFKDYYTVLEQQNFKATSTTQKAQSKLKNTLLPT